MKKTLYIVGNGFDSAHGLPTKYDPDFKNIAEKNDNTNFWELYQSKEDSIWADFENLLAYPDFNSLQDIFIGYEPEYSSDKESDRTSIIFQVDLNGQLYESLNEFVARAESSLKDTHINKYIENIIEPNGYYVSFNYTHTLEYIYKIPKENVLHIHGEDGKNNLIIGYPKNNFSPEKYFYDVRMKGRGPYAEMDIKKYINNIEDYYTRTAFDELYKKCKSFYKDIRIDLLNNFLNNKRCEINKIIVYGHSCEIDFEYFSFLANRYPKAFWCFYAYNERQEIAMNKMVTSFSIKNYSIIKI